jgi:hypothetical protein
MNLQKCVYFAKEYSLLERMGVILGVEMDLRGQKEEEISFTLSLKSRPPIGVSKVVFFSRGRRRRRRPRKRRLGLSGLRGWSVLRARDFEDVERPRTNILFLVF